MMPATSRTIVHSFNPSTIIVRGGRHAEALAEPSVDDEVAVGFEVALSVARPGRLGES